MSTPRLVEDLAHRFNYHPPLTDVRRRQHELVRADCLALAQTLDEALPDGREKSLAITKIEEAMFWANAALARHPDPDQTTTSGGAVQVDAATGGIP